MRARDLLGYAALLSFACAGCAADLGAGAGGDAASAHPLLIGRAAVSSRISTPMNERGFLVGASIESRSEPPVGSRFTAGLMAGYGSGPQAVGGGGVGWELYGEFGTPLRATLFENGRFYAGAGLNLPFRLSEARTISELDDSTWVAIRRVEIVPTLRYRLHVDGMPVRDSYQHHDVALLVSLRFRAFSDLF